MNFKKLILSAFVAVASSALYFSIRYGFTQNPELLLFNNLESVLPLVIVFAVTFVVFYLVYKVDIHKSKYADGGKVEPPAPVPEPPKPTTYDAIMKLTVLNSKIDKEIVYKAGNNFGLNWVYGEKNSFVVIYQWLGVPFSKNVKKRQMAVLIDFSIKEIEWQTFPLLADEASSETQNS